MAEPSEARANNTTEPTPSDKRGRHKVYVGMAAGVGKTYRALHEVRELLAQGKNVVIGILETHGRQDTEQVAAGLPVIPRRELQYKDATLTEMDLDAILTAHPDVVFIDDLAHTNAPGSRHPRRHQDIAELLDAGINVISTVNIQHLESLNDLIARLTGVRVRDRLPDHVVQSADEVVLVDVSAQTLQARLRAGKIYAPDKAEQALKNFYTEENLGAMREIALRQVADAVQNDIEEDPGVKERILVACAAEPESGRLIRRGGRLAQRLNGELDVVYVESTTLNQDGHELIQHFRETTEALGGHFKIIPNRGSVGRTLVEYVRDQHITQIVIGESSRSRWQEFIRGSIVHTILRETKNVDVYVLTRE